MGWNQPSISHPFDYGRGVVVPMYHGLKIREAHSSLLSPSSSSFDNPRFLI